MRTPVIVAESGRVRIVSNIEQPYCANTMMSQWIGVHGCGVVSGQFVTCEADLTDISVPANPAAFGVNIHGSITLYGLNAAGRMLILPDPFGSGLVFRYRVSGFEAVSSDLAALVNVVSKSGHTVKRSLRYACMLAATGSGGLGLSPYEGVEYLESGTWLWCDEHGIHVERYSDDAQLTICKNTNSSGLDAVREELACNVRAAADYAADFKIAHLTGGIDSRIVVAALRQQKGDSSFALHCTGVSGDRDFDVARGVSASIGMPMTKFGGLIKCNRATTFRESILGSFYVTSGVAQTVANVWCQPTSCLVLSGGYGEFLRSFYNRGGLPPSDIGELAQHMYGQFALGVDDEKSLLASALKTQLRGAIARRLRIAQEMGIREDARLDYIYMTERNRFFVGEISRAFSLFTPRFDPLYSVTAARLALSVPGNERNANVLGLDLLRSLDSEMSEFPFDTDRYSGFYESVRGPVAKRAFTSQEPRWVIPPFEMGKTKPGAWNMPKATEEQQVQARELNMPSRFVVQFHVVQKELPSLISSLPAEERDKWLNVNLVQRWLTRPISNRVVYRGLFNLHAALTWYLFVDEFSNKSFDVTIP